MSKQHRVIVFFVLVVAWLLAGCGGAEPTPTPSPTPAPTLVPTPVPATPSPAAAGPAIASVTCGSDDCTSVTRYGKLELIPSLAASYTNPYDQREVALDAVFTGPDGNTWQVPGFWDGETQWLVRFTPGLEGDWSYALTVTDKTGTSQPTVGTFSVLPSEQHGWLQVANWVNGDLSPRYLAHVDGTPFFGVGQCNAIDLFKYGFDAEQGFGLFNQMAEVGANTIVFWPLYSPFFNRTYSDYSFSEMRLIDLVVEDAAEKNIYIVFTVWNHGLLRDKTHPWGNPNWESHNGFNQLGSVEEFFTTDEMWAWQENLYRYIIARWGYSPAIGLWQTVSEIEGTNAGVHTDDWHTKVNAYFTAHDPYRHPTTASMAGDQWWPEGYAVADVAQIHSYDTSSEVIAIGPRMAYWTRRMWDGADKPNFIGEFGTVRQLLQPDHVHNGMWAGVAAGAALTPMDWNDGGDWGKVTPDMLQQMGHVATFVADLPLAAGGTQALTLTAAVSNTSDITATVTITGQQMIEKLAGVTPTVGVSNGIFGTLGAWGMGGDTWGMAWVQDLAQIDGKIADIRKTAPTLTGVALAIAGVADGSYRVLPYDTWQGQYLPELVATAQDGTLTITLPAFRRDLAVRWEQK